MFRQKVCIHILSIPINEHEVAKKELIEQSRMPHPVPEKGFIQIKSMDATFFARTEAMRPNLRSPDSSVQMATMLNRR
jgi:hypothetical protein